MDHWNGLVDNQAFQFHPYVAGGGFWYDENAGTGPNANDVKYFDPNGIEFKWNPLMFTIPRSKAELSRTEIKIRVQSARQP